MQTGLMLARLQALRQTDRIDRVVARSMPPGDLLKKGAVTQRGLVEKFRPR